MKKKLEADLISIAHRILKMKNKSDILQLHQEAQRLYEKLTVLKFVEEHFAGNMPTLDYTKTEAHLAVIFENDIPTLVPDVEASMDGEAQVSAKSSEREKLMPQGIVPEDKPYTAESEPVMESQEPPASEESSEEEMAVPAELAGGAEAAPEPQEETSIAPEPEQQIFDEPSPEIALEAPAVDETPVAEENPGAEEPSLAKEEFNTEDAPTATVTGTPAPESSLFKPSFELSFDARADEPAQSPSHLIKETQFAFDDLLGKDYSDPVFVKPEELEREKLQSSPVIPIARSYTENAPVISMNTGTDTLSINERLGKGLTIGLNDRIAFMNHLFNNSSEDYNRVLSQLITFGTLNEARDFIDNMVKPDYNDWNGKEEYEQRFMEIIEKRFA